MALSVLGGVYRMASFLSGFILLEVAFAILVLGVIGAIGLSGYRTVYEHRAYGVTEQRIERVFMALASYVKRNGTLPCPALPGSDGAWATDSRGCPHLVGLVPYETLGISERDTIDGWQRPIVYAMDQDLHVAPIETLGHSNILIPFCDRVPLSLSITHDIGRPGLLHPAVVLISHGPTGPSGHDPSKAYNMASTYDFVDQSTDNTFDDIVRFVTREHLLAFYGQAGCPVVENPS